MVSSGSCSKCAQLQLCCQQYEYSQVDGRCLRCNHQETWHCLPSNTTTTIQDPQQDRPSSTTTPISAIKPFPTLLASKLVSVFDEFASPEYSRLEEGSSTRSTLSQENELLKKNLQALQNDLDFMKSLFVLLPLPSYPILSLSLSLLPFYFP